MTRVIYYELPQLVRVRKYDVDIPKLKITLRNAKKWCGFSNSYIAEVMDVPVTLVEHWFRMDKCFSIPSEDLWIELKNLLKIETDEFDESIMTFEEREGVYDMAERVYDAEGIAPTLTANGTFNILMWGE